MNECRILAKTCENSYPRRLARLGGESLLEKLQIGSEKMQENTERKVIESTTNVTDRLPELDEEDTSTALENIRWAAGFVGAPQGVIYNDAGVDLQVVATRTVRCVAVADHPYCYRTLAMMALSFETAGVELEVEPYTIIRTLPPEEEQDEQGSGDEDTGMEVA